MRANSNPVLGFLLIALGICCSPSVSAAGALLVVAHPDTPTLNEETLQKIYLGKVIEVGGHPMIPINLTHGNVLRKTFMEQILAQDDDKFIAYWTVRRYIGKGSPPREFSTVDGEVEFLRATPGAIGYLDDSTEIKPGLKTILKKMLAQDDDKFIAYWTVRRYIGKDSPPHEYSTVDRQMEFLRTIPGAVGYLDDSTEIKP